MRLGFGRGLRGAAGGPQRSDRFFEILRPGKRARRGAVDGPRVRLGPGWRDLHLVGAVDLDRLRVRGERYSYEDAEAETPLSQGEDDGWRFTWGATVLPHRDLSLDADYHAEKGPGASSRGWSASASWRPREGLSLTGYAANTLRPLEYRTNEAEAWWYGADASWEPFPDLRLGLGVTRYDEERDRPDAGGLDWDQTRLTFRVTWLLDSGADRWRLPPGAMPDGRGDR